MSFTGIYKIVRSLKKISYKIVRSIAFYPVLISTGFLLFALVIIFIENSTFISALKEKVPYLFIQDIETASTILATLIGGILSLTVFSFSMVMVVLNQASSNFSPRLLPGLISDKRHQVILGVYIGTLLYCIIIMIFMGAYGIGSESIGTSATMGAIFGVCCVGFFAYFIHNISVAIQIEQITHEIYEESSEFLAKEFKEDIGSQLTSINTDTRNWQLICADRAGYFRNIGEEYLSKEFKKTENSIEIIPYSGQHIWLGDPILLVKNSITQDEKEKLQQSINFSSQRLDVNKGLGGLIKLMEVIVKAMSPGINDPGTAIDAIAKLIELLHAQFKFSPQKIKSVKNGTLLLIHNYVPAAEVVRMVLQPIRLYAKNDNTVMYELIKGLQSLQTNPEVTQRNKQEIGIELEAIKLTIENTITNSIDKNRILKVF